MSAESYLASLYEPDPEFEKIQSSLQEKRLPQISVEPAYGKLLTLLVRLSGAREILEIGALAGYSGICLARGLAGGGHSSPGRLVSLEQNPEFADLALSHMQAAGFGDLVEYRIGPALDHLENLIQEGRKFDFFFIDADKINYPNYLEWSLKLARPGSIIVGDNLLMRGRTIDPNVTKASVEAMRAFNRQFASDARLESVMLPSFDGLAIARVK